MKKLLAIIFATMLIISSITLVACNSGGDKIYTEMGYDIIVVAGQSNAVGNGAGEDDYVFEPQEKIYELCGEYNAYVSGTGEDAKIVVDRISSKYFVRLAKDKVGSAWNVFDNFALRFADKYRENNLYETRKVLIVQTAISGTGFAKEHWGVGDVLYERMCNMVSYALSIEGENRVVAFLWHQGEHDVEANANFSYNQRKDFYYNKLNQMLTDFRKEFGQVPFVCAGYTSQFCEKYSAQSQAVYEAINEVVRKNRKTAFVSNTSDLLSNDEKVSNGDIYHFCKQAQTILGERYYEKWVRIK